MYGIKKIYASIKEGIIPEMDEVKSFSDFAKKLKEKDVCFFGNRYLNAYRNGGLYKSIVVVYKCLYEDFSEGSRELSSLREESNFSRMFGTSMERFKLLSKDEFVISLTEICDERRKKYKLLKKM